MTDTPQVTPMDSYRVRVAYTITSAHLKHEVPFLFEIHHTVEITVQAKSVLLVSREVLSVLRREYSPNAVIRKMRVERVAPEVKS